MKSRRTLAPLLLGAALALAGPVLSASGGSDVDADSVAPPPSAESPPSPAEMLVFAIEVGNRMFPQWSEVFRVGLHESFYLGDTEYTAAANRFLPDFRIGDSGPFSLTEERNNPALEMIVSSDTSAVDTTWAFKNFPPHFSPRSFFTFKILDVSPAGTGGDQPIGTDGE